MIISLISGAVLGLIEGIVGIGGGVYNLDNINIAWNDVMESLLKINK